jgi:hypothetical protein
VSFEGTADSVRKNRDRIGRYRLTIFYSRRREWKCIEVVVSLSSFAGINQSAMPVVWTNRHVFGVACLSFCNIMKAVHD